MYIILKLQPYFFNCGHSNFSVKYPYLSVVCKLFIAYVISRILNFFVKQSFYTTIFVFLNGIFTNESQKYVGIYIILSGLWHCLNDIIFTNEIIYYFLLILDKQAYDIDQMNRYKRIGLWDIIWISFILCNAYFYFVPSSYNDIRFVKNIVDVAKGLDIDAIPEIERYIKYEFFTNLFNLIIRLIIKLNENFTKKSL